MNLRSEDINTKRLDIDKTIEAFKEQHPEVRKAMELFNISSEQYEISRHALEGVPKIQVTTSTILPLN